MFGDFGSGQGTSRLSKKASECKSACTRWWARLCTKTNCISLVSGLLATGALALITWHASRNVDGLQGQLHHSALQHMADDPDAIWGLCGGLLGTMEGVTLFWNFSMRCDVGHNKSAHGAAKEFIVNPSKTFAFLNNLTQDSSRRCYDVQRKLNREAESETPCDVLFQSMIQQANASEDYLSVAAVQDHGQNYLRDVISLQDSHNKKMVFRIGGWNACYHMVVDITDAPADSWYIAQDLEDLELIRVHQNAVCPNQSVAYQTPKHWAGRYSCIENVISTDWAVYNQFYAQEKETYNRPAAFMFMQGNYDDWYGLFTGVLAGLVGSVATLAVLVLVAVLSACFPEEDEKEKTVEAMYGILQSLEARFAEKLPGGAINVVVGTAGHEK